MITILFYFLLFSPAFVLNQPKVTVLSSLKPEEKILYVYVDNHIKIEGINIASTRLSISNGDVYHLGKNEYLIHVSAIRPDTLSIYQGKKLVAAEIFQIRGVPYPVARLGNLKDTIAKVNQILVNPSLTVYLPDCHYKHQFYITSFSLSCITTGNDTTATFNTNGNIFSDKQKSVIKTLKAGEEISFYNIKALCPHCGGRSLHPFKIYIR